MKGEVWLAIIAKGQWMTHHGKESCRVEVLKTAGRQPLLKGLPDPVKEVTCLGPALEVNGFCPFSDILLTLHHSIGRVSH